MFWFFFLAFHHKMASENKFLVINGPYATQLKRAKIIKNKPTDLCKKKNKAHKPQMCTAIKFCHYLMKNLAVNSCLSK